MLPGINAFAGNSWSRRRAATGGARTQFAQNFGAQHAYTSYDEMLAIPTSPSSRSTRRTRSTPSRRSPPRAQASTFLRQADGDDVARCGTHHGCVRQAGVKLGVNFHNRFMPGFIDAKRIIESGEIGDVRSCRSRRAPAPKAAPGRPGAPTRTRGPRHDDEHRRAHLRHPALHALAPRSRRCRRSSTRRGTSWRRPTCRRSASATASIAHVSIHEITPYPHNDFVIYGTKDASPARPDAQPRRRRDARHGRRRQARVQEYPAINAHEACVIDFSKAILEGREPAPPASTG